MKVKNTFIELEDDDEMVLDVLGRHRSAPAHSSLRIQDEPEMENNPNPEHGVILRSSKTKTNPDEDAVSIDAPCSVRNDEGNETKLGREALLSMPSIAMLKVKNTFIEMHDEMLSSDLERSASAPCRQTHNYGDLTGGDTTETEPEHEDPPAPIGGAAQPLVQHDPIAAVELQANTSTSASTSTTAQAKVSTCSNTGTTLMLRNFPNNYTRQNVLDLLDSKGFKGTYDFLYLPFDFERDCNTGYAFANFMSNDDVEKVTAFFTGFADWIKKSAKIGAVCPATVNGQANNIAHWRNKPVMHHLVPERYKPILLKDGEVVPFPPATKKRIRLPQGFNISCTTCHVDPVPAEAAHADTDNKMPPSAMTNSAAQGYCPEEQAALMNAWMNAWFMMGGAFEFAQSSTQRRF